MTWFPLQLALSINFLSISSPTASSSNATEKLHHIHLEMEGRASALGALVGHSLCPSWNPGTYSNGL